MVAVRPLCKDKNVRRPIGAGVQASKEVFAVLGLAPACYFRQPPVIVSERVCVVGRDLLESPVGV